MFTDDNTYIIKIQTKKQKNKWLKNLKIFYNYVYTCISLNKLTKRL